MHGCHSGLVSTAGKSLDTNAQPEAEAQVRQVGEQLKAEKNVQLSTTLLASGLTDKVGEQNNKLETFACHFAE